MEYERDLSGMNTFWIKSTAHKFFEFYDDAELIRFYSDHRQDIQNYFILGGGSNVLLPSYIKKTVIHPGNQSLKVIKRKKNSVVIEVGAGKQWDKLVEDCTISGWYGLENLSLIPGSVGAAPVQNIGAYGSEVSERIRLVRCFNLETGEFITLNSSECDFSYRSSIFKSRKELVITNVVFELDTARSVVKDGMTRLVPDMVKGIRLAFKTVSISLNNSKFVRFRFESVRDILGLSIIPPKLKRALVVYIRKRTMHDPKDVGNVGCFFKSPIVNEDDIERIREIDSSIGFYVERGHGFKVSAGDMISSCGFKGKKLGNVYVDKNRPLILLNYGKARSEEVSAAADIITESVFEKFSVQIEPEVVVLTEAG